jgi:uncharacterized membrane protein YgcG
MCNNKKPIDMKTKCINLPMPSINPVLGFLSMLFFVACGSYQNSSYYDTDGIYGTTEAGMRKKAIAQETATAYQNYFGSLQDAKDTTSVFTDVENYSSYSNTENTENESNYPGWGSNNQDVTINYFQNNWGSSFGFGFPNYGYSWRNMYYGGFYPYNYWNDPFMMGWGFNNFYGYGYNYYPNNYWGYQNYGSNFGSYNNGTSYNYNESRRGSNYKSVNPSGNEIGRREIQNSTSNYSNRNLNNRTSTAPTFSRNSNTIQNENYLNNNIGRSRVNSFNNPNSTPNRTNSRNDTNPSRRVSPSRNESYTPSRTNDSNPTRRETQYNNESYTPSRSMDTNSSNSGGGRSYGGGGRRGGK